MRTQSYPSDVTDAQWVLIEPHLPVYPGGRPRKTNLRDAVDASFYVRRTGCQWRYLPKKVRTAQKPPPPRTTASVDSQSVDTTGGGERRGRDNAKTVDGRTRHI